MGRVLWRRRRRAEPRRGFKTWSVTERQREQLDGRHSAGGVGIAQGWLRGVDRGHSASCRVSRTSSPEATFDFAPLQVGAVEPRSRQHSQSGKVPLRALPTTCGARRSHLDQAAALVEIDQAAIAVQATPAAPQQQLERTRAHPTTRRPSPTTPPMTPNGRHRTGRPACRTRYDPDSQHTTVSVPWELTARRCGAPAACRSCVHLAPNPGARRTRRRQAGEGAVRSNTSSAAAA